MANTSPCKSIVRGEFFKPIFGFLEESRFRRNGPALPDELWLEAGMRRCIGLFQSGRDFLQNLAECHDTEILLTPFFESLKSKRRLTLLSDILAKVQTHMRRALPDAFADFRDVADFDLYAGDGHFIAAASHDKAAPRKSPAKSRPVCKKTSGKKADAKPVGRVATFTATKYPPATSTRSTCVTTA